VTAQPIALGDHLCRIGGHEAHEAADSAQTIFERRRDVSGSPAKVPPMAEMSMNKAIHGAIRRDLTRFVTALETFPPGDTGRSQQLGPAWENFDDLLTHHHEGEIPVGAMAKLADALPAFGIVAAVMGVVHTMESVGLPPAELGKLIAAALVGTFLGILLSYGFVGPLATLLEHKLNEQTKMLQCIKVTLLASLNGYAPQVAVEFGRKVLYSTERPSFTELETEVKQRKGK